MLKRGLPQVFEPLRIDGWVVGLIWTVVKRLSLVALALTLLLMLATSLSFASAISVAGVIVALLAAALTFRFAHQEWPSPHAGD